VSGKTNDSILNVTGPISVSPVYPEASWLFPLPQSTYMFTAITCTHNSEQLKLNYCRLLETQLIIPLLLGGSLKCLSLSATVVISSYKVGISDTRRATMYINVSSLCLDIYNDFTSLKSVFFYF